MINFFRKTRKKLADDNKFFKYSRYAIGEIVLVVIGILIALQINNWNEGRKGKEKLNILFEQVQKELLVNIKKTDEATEFYWGKDSLINNVLNNKVNYDDYKSNFPLSHLITQEFKVDLLDDAFKNLIDYNVQLSKDTDSLIYKLKGLYGKEKKEVDEYDKQVLDMILFNLREIENQKKWYSNYIYYEEVPDDAIAYYLTDTIYRNRVANFFMIGIENHYVKTRVFRNSALNIYEDVCDYLNLEKDTSIVKDLNDYKHYLGV